MIRTADLLSLTAMASLLALALAPALAPATTIVVNSSSDAVAIDGACTLREAMIAADTNSASGVPGECPAGTHSPVVDTIQFAISGSGVHTIAVTDTLPPITEAVTIDGYSQPGTSVNTLAVGDNAVLLIRIDGTAMPAFTSLFQFKIGGGSSVRGLVISHAPGMAFQIGANGFSSDNNTIAGNFIATDPSGTLFQGGSTQGMVAVHGASNIVGGATPAARNVIGGSNGGSSFGTVFLSGDPFTNNSGNIVQGNYIGINATGTGPLLAAGATEGIVAYVQTNATIGGSAPGAGNVILAAQDGISVVGGNGITIQGNTLGTDATGSTALGGSAFGIVLIAPQNITIGGAAVGAGNLISGVGTGISISDNVASVTVQGNKIGTDRSGTGALLNSGIGINISAPSAGSIVGGTHPGEGNTIAFNCGRGVFLGFSTANTGWAILGNSIHSNGSLGISFEGAPTPNDPGDADTGPNNLQNYPVITSALISGGTATISGTLNSTPNVTFRLEFFAGSGCDASGFGEGRHFIGTTNVTTDNNGNASFGPLPFAVPPGDSEFTATATDASGNTSEFSQCFGPHDHVFGNNFEFAACAGAAGD